MSTNHTATQAVPTAKDAWRSPDNNQPPTTPTTPTTPHSNLGPWLGRYSGVLVWAALFTVFAIWVPDTFLTTTTFKSVLGDQAITAVLALGILFAFAAGQFDISCAQNLGLSAVVCSSLIVWQGFPWPLAVITTLAMGALIGAINGTLVLMGVDSFIATLGMGSVLLALTQYIGGSSYIGPIPDSFQSIATGTYLGIPIVALYALALAFIIWYALEHTPIGRRAYATGANTDAARLAGVNTSRYKITSLILAGTISSLAGTLVAAKIGSVSPTVGPPYLLPAFAVCLMGTTQIKTGRFNVWGTILALVLLATGVKGLQLAGGQLWITDLFNGIALIGAVSVAVYAKKRKAAKTKTHTATQPT